jgi:hypothetical protein
MLDIRADIITSTTFFLKKRKIEAKCMHHPVEAGIIQYRSNSIHQRHKHNIEEKTHPILQILLKQYI